MKKNQFLTIILMFIVSVSFAQVELVKDPAAKRIFARAEKLGVARKYIPFMKNCSNIELFIYFSK